MGHWGFFLKGVSFRRTHPLPSHVSQLFLHGIVSSSLRLFLPSGLEFRSARRAVIVQDALHRAAVPLPHSHLSCPNPALIGATPLCSVQILQLSFFRESSGLLFTQADSISFPPKTP